MCGIAGFICKKDSAPGVVLEMLEEIAHRGPDGCGIVYCDGEECSVERSKDLSELERVRDESDFAIGHVRLAIVGEESAHQPFFDCSGRITVLHNGEIYNYRSLRRRVGNHRFVSRTDSEVIRDGW